MKLEMNGPRCGALGHVEWVVQVIESCQTEEQLTVAKTLSNLLGQKIEKVYGVRLNEYRMNRIIESQSTYIQTFHEILREGTV